MTVTPAGRSITSDLAPATVHGRRAVALVASLVLGVISYILNTTMIYPALPNMAAQFHVSVVSVSTVSTSFALSSAICGTVLARWGDFFGRRRAQFAILVIAAAGAFICVLAPNLGLIILGRVLMGASAAAYTMAWILAGGHLGAKAFGLSVGVITAFAGGVSGLDTYGAGLLLNAWGYRSIFVVIGAITILALATTLWWIPGDNVPRAPGRMDWPGSIVLGIALAGLTLLLAQTAVDGWLSPLSLTYSGVSIAGLLGFWFLEKKRSTPLIAPAHLRSRYTWPLVATTVLSIGSGSAVLVFIIVFLSQDAVVGYGMDPAVSSLLYLVPAAVAGTVIAPMCGFLATRVGYIRLLRISLMVSVPAIVLLAVVPENPVLVFFVVLLLGISYNGVTNTTLGGLQVFLSPDDAPAALPSIMAAAFGIGFGLGVGIVAPYVGAQTVGGFVTALLIAAGLMFLSLVASFWIVAKPGQEL